MTNQSAIDCIKKNWPGDSNSFTYLKEALHQAIEALEEKERATNAQQTQAAICTAGSEIKCPFANCKDNSCRLTGTCDYKRAAC